MNSDFSPWRRLVSAARRAPDGREDTAPYGFSTRVAAAAFSTQAAPSLLERYALRALGMAALLTVGVAAANLGPILHSVQEEADALSDLSSEPIETS